MSIRSSTGVPQAVLEILRPYPFSLANELKANFKTAGAIDRNSSLAIAASLGQLFIVFAILSKSPVLEASARSECNIAALNMLKIDNYTSLEAHVLKIDNEVKNVFFGIILNHIIKVKSNNEDLQSFFCSILISIVIPLISCWVEGCISSGRGLQDLLCKGFIALEQDYQQRLLVPSSGKAYVAKYFARSWNGYHTRYQSLGDRAKGFIIVAFLSELCNEALAAHQDGDPKNREKRTCLIDALLDFSAAVKR